jgi:histidinol-phosphate aminotransferase
MKVRQAIARLTSYVVPQDNVLVKLNQNESPYDLPKTIKQEIINRLIDVPWNRYPAGDARILTEALAEYTQFPVDGISIGNGSNEMLYAVFTAICDQGDRILLVSPGFSMFHRLARIMDLEILDIPLLNDFQFDIPQIIRKAHQAQLVVLATPNNPTGTVLDHDAINEILGSTDGVVVIDEAYYEFHKESAQRLSNKFDNLIITRTFSKAFGLAGIRLGYVLSQPHVAREIEKAKLPFSVGIFQQSVGEIVLKHSALLEDIVKEIIHERELLFAKFILFEVQHRSALETFDALYKNGVLVRHFESDQIGNMLRVTIGKSDENEKFINCLLEIMEV